MAHSNRQQGRRVHDQGHRRADVYDFCSIPLVLSQPSLETVLQFIDWFDPSLLADGLAVRNANLSTTYLRNDVSRDVCDQRLVIVLDVSEVKQKGASSSVSAYVGDISANFLKPNCNSKDEVRFFAPCLSLPCRSLPCLCPLFFLSALAFFF